LIPALRQWTADVTCSVETDDQRQIMRGAEDDWRIFRLSAFRFCVLFVFAWLSFYAIYVRFPYIRNGADVIYSTKIDYVGSHSVFDTNSRYRIGVFGDSRALAAFRPSDFDAAFDGNTVQSFNLGLPGDENFLPILQDFLNGGNRPTHVLIATAWPDLPKPTLLSIVTANKAINQFLFPFHNLPRDLALFAFDAFGGRGLAGQYAYGREQAAAMIADRGWYFIAGQSHFPNDQLPSDYALPSDTPTVQYARPVYAKSYLFQRLAELAAQYNFEVWLIPTPFRRGEFAPLASGTDNGLATIGSERVDRVGPDYVLFPPPQFSDPVHLNRFGAKEYSQYLAKLLKPELER
jgi:hypothetical protein